MKDKKTSIRANSNGPYTINGPIEVKTSKGDSLPVDSVVYFCRCGKSQNKPFCDSTHVSYGFTSNKLEGRLPDKIHEYVGKEITIYDNRGVCSHNGNCTTKLPKVFFLGKEPWIDPEGAEAQEIATVIRTCPSGALSYKLNGTKYINWEMDQEINISKNGPLEICGAVEYIGEQKEKPQTMDHYTLCRCGGSKNKPFCDGTHWNNGFND